MIDIPVSYGELVDKLTILYIKTEFIKDTDKLANITKEMNLLMDKYKSISQSLPPEQVADLEKLRVRLHDINKELWDVEDNIRDRERHRDFGSRFINLARSVYIHNDKRSEVKREINTLFKSGLVEEKSYTNYQSGT